MLIGVELKYAAFCVICVRTVSYTHLDVYKRQSKARVFTAMVCEYTKIGI